MEAALEMIELLAPFGGARRQVRPAPKRRVAKRARRGGGK
jgi:hypothetical protein